MSSNISNLDAGGDADLTREVSDGFGQAEQAVSVASQLEAGADEDIDVSKVEKAPNKSMSKAAGSEDKVKTPRKRGPQKQAGGNADAEDIENDSAKEKGGEVTKPTPKKRGAKVKKANVEGENEDAGIEDGAEYGTPKATPVKKRTPKAKLESGGGEAGTFASGSSKKRASLGGAGEDLDGTPSKKPRASLTKVPTTRAELTEADKLMMEMKEKGKTWGEITAAVSNLTGMQYGKSTLGNRYTKIVNALIEWKEGDIERMLFVREKVEQEIEAAILAFKKEAESKIWSNMAKAMVEIGADEYSGGAVEKAYNREKKEGFPHRATVAVVMAGAPSAGGVKNGVGLDADGGSDEADDVNGLELEEDVMNMDGSADVEASKA